LASFTITGTFTVTSLPGQPTAANDPPIGRSTTIRIDEDTPRVLAIDDFGFDDPLDQPPNAPRAVRIEAPPSAGKLLLDGRPVDPGQEIGIADLEAGRLVYRPPTDVHGAALAAIDFRLRDDGGTVDGGIDLDPVLRSLMIDVVSVDDAARIDLDPQQPGTGIELSWDPALSPSVAIAPQAQIDDIDERAAILVVTLSAEGQAVLPDGDDERLVIPQDLAVDLGARGVAIDVTAADRVRLQGLVDDAEWMTMALRGLLYTNTAALPTPGVRLIGAHVEDRSGEGSEPSVATLTILDALRPPALRSPASGTVSDLVDTDAFDESRLTGSFVDADADDPAAWSWSLPGGAAGVGEFVGSWVSMTAHGRFMLDPASGDFAYEPRAEAIDALRGDDAIVERFLVTAGNRAGITERSWEVVLRGAEDSPTALLVEGEPVPENAPEGTVLLRLSALDPDRDERFVFSLVSGDDAQPDDAAVDPRVEISGQVLRIATGGRLDHERSPELALTLRVTDSAGRWFEQPVTIAVLDVLDEREDVLALDASGQRAEARRILDTLPMPEIALLPLEVRVTLVDALGAAGQQARLDAIETLFDDEELVTLWNEAGLAWFGEQSDLWLLRGLSRVAGADLLSEVDAAVVVALIDAIDPAMWRAEPLVLRDALIARLDEAMLVEHASALHALYGDADRLAHLQELPLPPPDGTTQWLLRDAVAALPASLWASLAKSRVDALLEMFAFGAGGEGLPDTDGDGAADWIEGLTPPPSAYTLIGDGNGDGIADAQQPAIRSAPLRVLRDAAEVSDASEASDAPDTDEAADAAAVSALVFATLAVMPMSANPVDGEALQIRAVIQTDAPPDAPAAMAGLLRLEIEGLVPGDGVALLFRVAEPLPVSGWWMQGPEGLWHNAAGPAVGGSVGTDGGVQLAFLLRDGVPGDGDGVIDGRLIAAGLLAATEPSLLAHTPDLPSAIGFWF
jgi:hypothetical protein